MIEHTLTFEYTRSGYTSFPRCIFNNKKKSIIRDIIKTLPLNRIILDVGCGSGIITGEFSNVIGLDYDPEAITYCRSKYPHNQYRKFDIEKDELEYVNYFDVIVFVESVEHFFNPEKILIKLKNALKPNGTLIITTPDYNSIFHMLISNIWYPIFARNYKIDNDHITKFNLSLLESTLNKCGFTSKTKNIMYGILLLSIAKKVKK